MNILRDLLDPTMGGIIARGLVVALAIASMASVLSVLCVLKRMAFVGQGVSHAAFGGMGLAGILGLLATGGGVGGGAGDADPMSAGRPLALLVVLAFCLACAWIVARLSDRRSVAADTAIGIVLVASMSLGAILLRETVRRPRSGQPAPAWESVLFGSLTGVAWSDAILAWTVALAVLAAAFAVRREMLFWAFDEPSAEAFGVPTSRMRALLLVLLTLAIVTSMRLAGVVLATALLILPGATALLLSTRWERVLVLSGLVGVLGTLAGLVLSYEADWPPGPSMVLALVLLFALARAARALDHRRPSAPSPEP